jgi:hypothetical protein
MRNIIKIYELLLIGFTFSVLLFSTITDSFEYFFNSKFYEGFSIVISTIIFALINLPILIIFTFRKDYKNLRVLGLLNLLVFVIGFLGFIIPLIILPLILSYGIYYISKEIKNRIKESNIIVTENQQDH